jgi:hypothetical protein
LHDAIRRIREIENINLLTIGRNLALAKYLKIFGKKKYRPKMLEFTPDKNITAV